MADTNKLQQMLDDLIKDKPEQAQVAFHDYLQDKMKDVVQPEQQSQENAGDPDSD